MLTRHRFRLQVDDRPGVLARVTAEIASGGGNVIAIDIHELIEGVAIDEISVAAPSGWDRASLAESLDRQAGVEVLEHAHQLHHRDPTVAAHTGARRMCRSRPGEQDMELARAIAEVTGASVAWSLPPELALDVPGGRAALERGSPVVVRVDVLPASIVSDIEPPLWVLAVADDGPTSSIVGFAARPLAVPFSASEVDRLVALLQLCREMRSPELRHQVC
jgi:hypothetical protein